MKDIIFEHKNSQRKVRCTKNIDFEPILLTTDDINEIYKYYHDQVMKVIDKHAPYIGNLNDNSYRHLPVGVNTYR